MASEVTLLARDTDLLKLAREIACDFFPIEEVLKKHKINSNQFERLKRDPRFQKILESEILSWHSAGNTAERTKLKAAALLEEFLPEANERIHDRNESLSAKTELVKTLARIAGVGLDRADINGAGEKFSVTINLGADHKLSFEKTVTPKVIDGEVVKES